MDSIKIYADGVLKSEYIESDGDQQYNQPSLTIQLADKMHVQVMLFYLFLQDSFDLLLVTYRHQ